MLLSGGDYATRRAVSSRELRNVIYPPLRARHECALFVHTLIETLLSIQHVVIRRF